MLKYYIYIFLLLLVQISHADVMGYLDPRTLAMGGTGVASANSSSAALYNPALLATYDNIKEKNKEGRLLFPAVSVRVTNLLNGINNFEQQDYERRLGNAVDTYNAAPNATNAQGVVNVADDLRSTINDILDDDYIADVYAGFVIGLPGEFEGGSFYLHRRLFGRASASVSAADRAIVDDYIAGLQFIASAGSQGQARPGIFNNNTLVDRSNDFTSDASIRALDVVEAGIAASSEYKLFGRYYYLGFTPKFQIIKAYDVFASAATTNDIPQRTGSKLKLNLDVGMATDFGPRKRLAIVVRNLYPHDIYTLPGNRIRIRPEMQAGYQYRYQRLTSAVDIDLITNNIFNLGKTQHNLNVGLEWRATESFALRGGYRHNISQPSTLGPFSLGLGWLIKRAVMDFAVAYGETEIGFALQFGIRF